MRLAGEITPGAMCDVLALLGQTGWRGELLVFDGESTRSVFFEQGNVVGAQTTVDDERLGSVLYRYGALTSAELEQILEKVHAGRRFGEAAMELGCPVAGAGVRVHRQAGRGGRVRDAHGQ